MINVVIDETKPLGRRILQEIANKPSVGTISSNIERDADGRIKDTISIEDFDKMLTDKLSAHYGVDLNSL